MDDSDVLLGCATFVLISLIFVCFGLTIAVAWGYPVHP